MTVKRSRTAGLVAHVMVPKFAHYLPLYRKEKIFGCAGLNIPRSTLAQWVGKTSMLLQPLGDALRETVLDQRAVHAVQMLALGEKKTHRAYVPRLQHAVLGTQGRNL